jgi:hypothetical protein
MDRIGFIRWYTRDVQVADSVLGFSAINVHPLETPVAVKDIVTVVILEDYLYRELLWFKVTVHGCFGHCTASNNVVILSLGVAGEMGGCDIVPRDQVAIGIRDPKSPFTEGVYDDPIVTTFLVLPDDYGTACL